MAIEYVFGTTAELTTEELLKLATDTIGTPDDAEIVSTIELSLLYEKRMSVYLVPPPRTLASPSQTHWKRILGSRPKIIINFRFVNSANADQNYAAIVRFIKTFLRLFSGDAVFYPATNGVLLLRYKGKIAVNSDDVFWAKEFERLDQLYSLISSPSPDSGEVTN